MSLVVDLSPAEEREVEQNAVREGVSVSEYVRRRVLPPDPTKPYHGTDKPFSVLQFSGIAPSGRTVEDVDRYLAELRDEEDTRDRALRLAPEPT